MIIPSGPRARAVALAVATTVGGTLVAAHYQGLGLTLSHYDARGHLVVARRVFDSITPGWQQIGAVWLPLPHLLNAIPVQVDAWYRSGASAVAISVAAFALAVVALARLIYVLTGSEMAAAAGAAVFALNPNVLYLQATPMTEPLYLALTTLAVALLMEWCGGTPLATFARVSESGQSLQANAASDPSERRQVVGVGVLFALACWTRYEAWPVTAAALVAAVWARWHQGENAAVAIRRMGSIALYPALAIASFALFSRVVVGEWLTTGGFFVPENQALGQPVMAAIELWDGTRALSGALLMVIAAIGMGAILAIGLSRRERSSVVVALSLSASAAVPWVAFIDGHPFRIRYAVPLIAMQAVAAGAATLLLSRWRVVGALLVLGVVAYELRPLDPRAPMVVEAQWDQPNRPVRERVTACLAARHAGDKIMASMGSLGHYMQDASRAGLDVRDFLHEGNGDIWLAALEHPRPFAGWILIEEEAEGGDMLATRARSAPRFLEGYSRVCEGAGLALYRRD